jgi:TolB-like protein
LIEIARDRYVGRALASQFIALETKRPIRRMDRYQASSSIQSRRELIGMTDVFIAHSQSTSLVQLMANALRDLGYTVWWDNELPVHRPYAKVIDERLTDAKAVIVLWSSEAVESVWVRDEAETARIADKLVQVTTDGAVPPRPFGQIQYADLAGWTGDVDAPEWRKVLASVAELVGRDRPTSLLAQVSPDIQRNVAARRRVIQVLLIALLTMAGIGAYLILSTRDRLILPRAFESAKSDLGSDGKSAGSSSFADRPTIAVLPFDNRSEDSKYGIFGDGLADELIGRLSAWRAFTVIGRASSFRYRGDIDIKQVAEALNIRYLVLGSVDRTADRVRVSAQLVDASTGATIWNQIYDRPIADFFALQDEISSAIAAPLVGDLSRAEADRVWRRGTQNLDAWGSYQLAEAHLTQLTPAETAAACPLYEQAIALEPQFASAHAGLAVCYLWTWTFAEKQVDGLLEQALKSARRAVALDPFDAYAQRALGFVLVVRKETRNGLTASQLSVELNPSSNLGWSTLAYAKQMSGDAHGSIAAAEWAIRLSPHDPLAWHMREILSENYFELGQFDAGLEQARAIISANPEFFWGYVDVALNAVGLGKLADARTAIVEARRVQPALSLELIQSRAGISDEIMAARWAEALRQAGLD